MRALCRGVALALMTLAATALSSGHVGAQAASQRRALVPPADLLGTWRISTAITAPWAIADSASLNRSAYLGRDVQLRSTALVGPGLLSCASPRYEATRMPPEGLFQGNLPTPAAGAARALGFGAGPVRGVSITCASGIFEAHLVDASHLLMALDNVIWTLDRSPGALAARLTPEGVVQALLERHFAGRMEFDSASVQRLQAFLSAALQSRIARYLATLTPSDEVPPINGDPFTGSQEYPTRFSVQRATRRGAQATVVVRFADGYASKTIRYQLQSTPAGWRIDDMVYDAGITLTSLLREPATPETAGPASTPVWAERAWQKESVARRLVRDSSVSPVMLSADFDGDGRADVAWLVRHRVTRARGVLIVHAGGRPAQQCGAGVLFGNGGDNFDWMDSWQLVPRPSGPGSALLVARSESASGRIEFHAGRYRWRQVGN